MIFNILHIQPTKRKHIFHHCDSIMKYLKEFVKSVPDYRKTDMRNYRYKPEDILLLVQPENIIDKIRKKGSDCLIELKANRQTLRYGIGNKVY